MSNLRKIIAITLMDRNAGFIRFWKNFDKSKCDGIFGKSIPENAPETSRILLGMELNTSVWNSRVNISQLHLEFYKERYSDCTILPILNLFLLVRGCFFRF